MRKIIENFKNMKLRKKLIISYLLACVIPLMGACLIIYGVSVKNLQETSLELASAFSSQIVMNIDDFIEEYDRVTKTVLVDNDIIYKLDNNNEATVMERVNYQLDLRKIMMRLTTLKPEIENICFLTSEDQFYQFNNEGTFISKEILKEQKWLQDIVASKENLVITAVHDRSYCDRNQDGIVFTVGRKILDYSGSYAGVLLLDLEPAGLIELSDEFLLTRNQYNIKISITDSNYGILYDSDVASGRITWEEAKAENTPLLDNKQEKDYLILSNETKQGDLKVNVVIPKSSLLFKINRIGYVTGFAVLGCMVVIIIISSFFSKMITKPIGRLQKRMGQVEEGEYKELLQKESDDEIGSLVNSYNRMVLRIKALIEDVYIAEIKQKNARYLALKTQINPHMLYNTLESIRMKALVNGADEVADMIKILAKMFRTTLSDSTMPHKISDELEYAQNYIKLQNMRFQNLFSLEVKLDEKIQDVPVISMVLQPIIENSIKHGLRGRGIALHIVVTGELLNENAVAIQICDNGKGMPPERMEKINALLFMAEVDKLKLEEKDEGKKAGIGLKNIAERIKLYYGDDYYLKVVKSGEDGTVVEICIPAVREQGSKEENL
ncbi:cache domain-containing sensor histidine kinase [Konateibacter massiliensis]|uniref:cache domain-containing sensor histidine kinase n=1 Tax=Konateibacter massiliensis TaxID=2002841 RepID=UPI000C15B3BD|nr:sensor histidine kinase [Konateibacter massiliensis]